MNHQDKFGRSPLHVAAAVDYASMVECILQHGGDIHIKTKGEEQTPVHYAAKNDAVNSLRMLLGHGANIDSRDSKNRTPLQVAAEMNSFKAAKLLVTEGAPVGVYDNLGNSALSLLIEKIPEVALMGLDQLRTTNVIQRREYYFLNYLEGAKLKKEWQETPARSPLEIAVQNERYDVVMHPVMRRLISVKWNFYGKRGAVLDLVFNLIYTILWSIVGVTLPRHGKELYLPLKKNILTITIHGLIVLFTLFEIKRQIAQTVHVRRKLVRWREWRVEQLEQDKQYCHPRWPQERKHLDSEILAVKSIHLVRATDNWIYFDWICLLLILATICTSAMFFKEDVAYWKRVNNHVSVIMLMILWLRMFKYARPFENAGPFVVIFRNVVGDILKWVVLNAIIIIPFTCAFWIEFGRHSETPAEGYTDVSSLLYNIFQMMIVGDYGWQNLVEQNMVMARILCGSFILVAGIITLNLLIALVTNTFERHYENAVANAIMQRAGTILLLQSRMGCRKRKKYFQFIRNQASPQIIQAKYGRFITTSPEDRVTIERVHEDVRRIKMVLDKRFGRRCGKGNKSDLETVYEDLGKVKKSWKELARDVNNLKLQSGKSLQSVASSKGPGDPCETKSTEVTADKNSNNNNNNNSYNNNGNDTNPKRSIAPTQPTKTRKRNQSRRARKAQPSTSEGSESDDVSITAQLSEISFSSRKPRGYSEDVDWSRKKERPSNGNSRRKRDGGKYHEWSPYEHRAEQSLQYYSPVPEFRHLHQRNAPHQPLIHMYVPDPAYSYPSVHQDTPPTTYYPDMSLQRQNLPRESRLQPTQPPPDVFQQRSEIEARRNTQDYFTQVDDFSIQRGYRGRSRSNVSQQVTQRSDQGSQYCDSDVLIGRKRFETKSSEEGAGKQSDDEGSGEKQKASSIEMPQVATAETTGKDEMQSNEDTKL